MRYFLVVVSGTLMGLWGTTTMRPATVFRPISKDVPSHGLARTPPMGWNSWNHFQRGVNDRVIRDIAAAMAGNKMRDVGYIYVIIDDTWEGTRDQQGNLRANEKFPDMKALADYVHSKGLKLGIYSSPGPKTCAGYEGSYGHEEKDAQEFANWGIDYLKYDLCSYFDIMKQEPTHQDEHERMVNAYKSMDRALKQTGRPIILSLCQYGKDAVWRWGASVGGNLWRTTGDIQDNYVRMSAIGFGQAGLAPYAGAGHWNDPDMLEVGNGGMSHDEYRTHMSLWALLAAPLLAGNDLTKATQETLELLTNPEVIAVDQDPEGLQGDRVSSEGPIEIWARPLAGGAKAVGIFNRSDSGEMDAELDLAKVGFLGRAQLRDLWQHKELGTFQGVYRAQIPSHGVLLLRISL